MIPVLTAPMVEPLLDWPGLVQALTEGHRRPPAQVRDVLMGRGDDRLLSRAAWIEGLGLGVKSVTVYPANPGRGRPSVQGAMVVFDEATGAPEALIDNALITTWKTAGDSLLGAKLLMRPGARRLAILGGGGGGGQPDRGLWRADPGAGGAGLDAAGGTGGGAGRAASGHRGRV